MAGLDAIAAGADLVLVAGVEVQTTVSAQMVEIIWRAPLTTGDNVASMTLLFRHFCGSNQNMCDDMAWMMRTRAFGGQGVYLGESKPEGPHARSEDDAGCGGGCGRKNQLLGNAELNPYLKLTDCSQVSDGASAMLLCSEAGLKALGRTESDVVEIRGTGHAVSSLYTDGDATALTTVSKAIHQSYAGAGIQVSDLDVAEVHDCFTVAELMTYEAMGLAQPGHAYEVIRSGQTELDGSLPVNTGGGLVGFGHPVGATESNNPSRFLGK